MASTTHEGWRWLSRKRNRRLIYAISAIICAILSVFPQPYIARAKILPQDSSSAGLGQVLNSLGGQLSAFANLLTGGRPPNDLYLLIGRSDAVTADVINRLKLVGPDRPYATVENAKISLAKRVDVRLLLGGVIEVETITYDKARSLVTTEAYVKAISAKVASLGRDIITSKRKIVTERFAKSNQRLRASEQALDAFKSRNRLASPEAQLGSELSLRTQLQAQLQARNVELQTLRQFAGPENQQLLAIQTEITTLQSRLARSERATQSATGPNVTGLTELSSQYLNLYRDYRFAQALYEVYVRASEQVAVEELVAENATYIQIVDATHLDPDRHFNLVAVALLALVTLLALFTELYAPATGMLTSQSEEE